MNVSEITIGTGLGALLGVTIGELSKSMMKYLIDRRVAIRSDNSQSLEKLEAFLKPLNVDKELGSEEYPARFGAVAEFFQFVVWYGLRPRFYAWHAKQAFVAYEKQVLEHEKTNDNCHLFEAAHSRLQTRFRRLKRAIGPKT